MVGGLIQTASGSGWVPDGNASDEAFGMGGPCRVEHPAGDNVVGAPEVDLFGGQHRDAAMAVLGIYT